MKRIAALAVLLLTGCAAGAQTRPAYVDVHALLLKHPLYQSLAQYDRQIVALTATLHTQFADAGRQIDDARTAVGHDLDSASSSAQAAESAIARQHFAQNLHFTNGPSGLPNPQAIQAGIARTYAQQHSALQGAARNDAAQYRSALLAQEQNAYATFVQSVNARSVRTYGARAQELREREAALLLDFARNGAAERLVIRAKLQTLVLDDARRHHLQAQLAVMQHAENVALDAMRASDARTLRAYEAQLRERDRSDIAKMAADLQARTAANLAARERVMSEQMGSAGSLHLPSAAAARSSNVDMQAQYQSLLHATPANTAAYTVARDDLASQLRDLHRANATNYASVVSQIASLRHDRQAAREHMIAQIMQEARREGAARGYSGITTKPTNGAADITPAVAADLRQLTLALKP